MQATIDALALKPFTKALTCLSKYGDNLTIYAGPEVFVLSVANSSMSAYCRFQYGKHFFSAYDAGSQKRSESAVDDEQETSGIAGQLLTKSLLSILKHRTVEKSVDKCELSIVEGVSPDDQDDPDNLDDVGQSHESKLIVRLHCKHGVVKTHRLLLMIPTSLVAPGSPNFANQSRLTISPRALRDMIEHFPESRGPKSDPQLVWNFLDDDVNIKSVGSSIDTKGKAQLATELTISSEEFELYDINSSPLTLAFHLREFNAAIAFAESMSLPLDIRFTDPADPLFIEIEGDNADTLFVISTSQLPSNSTSNSPRKNSGSRKNKKRERENEDQSRPASHVQIRKPAKAVQRSENRDVSRPRSRSSSTFGTATPRPVKPAEPLFLPGSQLSQADQEILRASGLEVDNMDEDELAAILGNDGEEIEMQPDYADNGGDSGMGGDPDSFELFDESQFAPTQTAGTRIFQPLFED